MTAPADDTVLIALVAVFTASTGYAAGRLHQWYRTGLDRDEAYRDGYDTATRSVFSMAARLIGPRRAARGTAVVASASSRSVPSITSMREASVTPPSAVLRPAILPAADLVDAPPDRGVPGSIEEEGIGRHLVPDELVQAPTYRLAPDRVARAKVRGAVPADDEARPPFVPRPRSS
ncbi:hypothetical protein ACIBSW_28630 [Actinoplanes sp. NPDC049668]|uniref:hypothetical protein n=1 Tax=unclassified Actinoplanes TaxID=2626549 RepID=UPI0033A194F9